MWKSVASSHFTAEEQEDLEQWVTLMGVIKFTKEVRVLRDDEGNDLRKRRALAIAEFALPRVGRLLAGVAKAA